jgi:hypothetical protein
VVPPRRCWHAGPVQSRALARTLRTKHFRLSSNSIIFIQFDITGEVTECWTAEWEVLGSNPDQVAFCFSFGKILTFYLLVLVQDCKCVPVI